MFLNLFLFGFGLVLGWACAFMVWPPGLYLWALDFFGVSRNRDSSTTPAHAGARATRSGSSTPTPFGDSTETADRADSKP